VIFNGGRVVGFGQVVRHEGQGACPHGYAPNPLLNEGFERGDPSLTLADMRQETRAAEPLASSLQKGNAAPSAVRHFIGNSKIGLERVQLGQALLLFLLA
jgi:hypothetical protein